MRGISPIVATVLLIAIVIAIGALLYTGIVQMLESSPKENRVYSVRLEAFKETPPPEVYITSFHYYMPVSTEMNWPDAFNYCKERGMFLATPTTMPQIDKLKDIIQKNGWSNAFIGVYQEPGAVEPDRGWKYITGIDVSPFFWKSGEPTNGLGAEHVAVQTLSGWNDVNALNATFFVCEKLGLGFTLQNLSKEGIIRINELTLHIYDEKSGDLLAAVSLGPLSHRFSVKGLSDTFEIPKIICDDYDISPGESTTCRLMAIPFKPKLYESLDLKLCLSGEGVYACDTISI